MDPEDAQDMELDPKPPNAPLSQNRLMNHVLNIFVIFQNLMSMLELQNILKCGRLNQNWNANTRKYIRERRICYAQIGKDLPCKQLEVFCRFLRTCKNRLPFNGVSVSPQCSSEPCPLSGVHDFSKVFDETALETFVKHLEILPLNQSLAQHPSPIWNQSPRIGDCLLKEFLHDFMLKIAPALSTISVSYPSIDQGFVTGLLQSNGSQNCLPNLKAIEFRLKPANMNPLVLESIFAATPNLRSFIGFLRSAQLESLISRGKTGIVRELVLTINQRASLLVQFALLNPRLKILTVPQLWDCSRSNLSEYKYILHLILKGSFKSLKELNVDFSVLRIIMKHFRISLPNLKVLRIRYCQSLDKQLGYRLLKSIDFSSLFPYLEIVELHMYESADLTNEFLVEEFEGFVPEHVCTSVTDLRFRSNWGVSWNTETLCVMRETFPNVKHFQVQHIRNLRTFLRTLWTTWTDLESIDMYVLDDTVRVNLDEIFCGISEDDVEELLAVTTMEELVWAEPEHCSITDLKNLKRLRIQLQHSFDCFRQDTSNNAFISRVTGCLAFAKMPELQVQIIRNECEWIIFEGFHAFSCFFNFRQLQPFAKIISIDPEYSWKQKFDFKNYNEPLMQF
ncbi:unnamed protein product [Allacma fusca]|uniref:Uncharacterized protein n=1 Tax=Allacma fusca TaxID=39272 RepID=A0A8J2JJ17_9HEXA|nr:unnamed protein product [Allacma fusca]